MGEKFHSMLVCDVPLVTELSALATEAVQREDGAGLRAFRRRCAPRLEAIDAFRVPLDTAALARTQGAFTRHDFPFARALVGVSRAERAVGKTAQTALIQRAGRLVRMIEMDAPAAVIETEIAYATAALEALDTADLTARLVKAGLDAEPDEASLVEACLARCVIPGRDDDIGLDELWDLSMDSFVRGAALADFPTIGEEEEPSPELLTRVVQRFGIYSTTEAREIFLEQWLRFCGSFGHYVPPVWGTGELLKEAAADVRALPDRPRDDYEDDERDDEREAALAERSRSLADELERAAREGNAVVEWVVKS